MMNFNLKITVALLVSWILSPNIIFSDLKNTKDDVFNKEFYKQKAAFRIAYNEAIEAIKKQEGFKSDIYTDVAGYKTIGYGHIVLEEDTFTDGISEKTADKILRKDFDFAVRFAKKETSLEGYKLIAVAHFIFSTGIGKFVRSNIKSKILKGESINSEFLRCVYYKNSKGQSIKHRNLVEMRNWEIEMFNRKTIK